MALLHGLHDFCLSENKTLIAVTVDHGLREEAKNEAQFVSGTCASLGVEHHVLSWNNHGLTKGIAQSAREARYKLLSVFCQSNGVGMLALGHTMDDQAETVLMRLKRMNKNADGRGLSGMSAQTIYCDGPHQQIVLVRPLLDVRRLTLREYLRERGLTWVEDPTNDDRSFERVRVRNLLEKQDELVEQLCSYARAAGGYRQALSNQVADYLLANTSLNRDFSITLKIQETLDNPVILSAIQTLVSVVGGRDHLTPTETLRRLVKNRKRCNVARVLIDFSGDWLTIEREARGLPKHADLSTKPELWDQRFWVSRDGVGRVEIRHTLGAFETFSPQFDWAIRSALTELFTNSAKSTV